MKKGNYYPMCTRKPTILSTLARWFTFRLAKPVAIDIFGPVTWDEVQIFMELRGLSPDITPVNLLNGGSLAIPAGPTITELCLRENMEVNNLTINGEGDIALVR